MVTAEGVPIEENIQLAAKGIQERVTLEREQESIRIVIEAAEALLKSREEKNKINQESRNE
jgi:hypothetical protein